jgi:Protein of unknown function (DUF2510)
MPLGAACSFVRCHPLEMSRKPWKPMTAPKRILSWALGTTVVSFGLGIMFAVQPQDPRGTDGQGMAVFGAFATSAVALLVALSAGLGWWQARREEDARPSPPAWHPDPMGAAKWRWWDGSRWTEHTA